MVIEAVIERATDGTFNVYCSKEIFSGAGDTIEEAKADMMQQIKFYKETAIAEGFKYPAFLDGEYSFSYKIDAVSLMQYYVNSGILSLAGLKTNRHQPKAALGIHQRNQATESSGGKNRIRIPGVGQRPERHIRVIVW